MKYFLLLIFFYNFSFAENLHEQEFLFAQEYIGITSYPEVVQEEEYKEGLFNKIDYKFSINKPSIQGIYSDKTIYVYDLKNLKLDFNKPECVAVERFIKTGYLIHEMVHYKQDINNETFEKTKEYINSEKEFDAFNKQLSFWKEFLSAEDENFKKCLNQSSEVWFQEYCKRNQKTNKAFDLYNFI